MIIMIMSLNNKLLYCTLLTVFAITISFAIPNEDAYSQTRLSTFELPDFSSSQQDVALTSDGRSLFVINSDDATIRIYKLDTPNNLNTATLFSTFDISDIIPDPMGIDILNDGRSIYIVGKSMIHQYSLNEAMTVLDYDNVSFTLLESNPTGIRFNSMGDRLYVIGESGITTYTLQSGNDIDQLKPQYNISLDNLENDNVNNKPTSIAISTDGSKLYIASQAGTIDEYTLDNAFDPSTAVYSYSYDTLNFESSPTGVVFSNDGGDKMFIVGLVSNNIHQIVLDVPFDLQSIDDNNPIGAITLDITKLSKSLVADHYFLPLDDNTDGFVGSGAHGIAFSNDGLKMFVSGTGDVIVQFNLDSPFDINNAKFIVSVPSNPIDGTPTSIAFNNDGTKLYVTDLNTSDLGGGTIAEFNLLVPFELETLVLLDSDTSDPELLPYEFQGLVAANNAGIEFNEDGTKLFIIGSSFGGRIYVHELCEPFDLSTIGSIIITDNNEPACTIFDPDLVINRDSITILDNSQSANRPNGMRFSNNGEKVYVTHSFSNNVRLVEYTLTAPYDLSFPIVTSNFYITPDQHPFINRDISINNLAFSNDGLKMFLAVIGKNNDGNIQSAITQIDLLSPFDIDSRLSVNTEFVDSVEPAELDATIFNFRDFAFGALRNEGRIFAAIDDDRSIYQFRLLNSLEFDVTAVQFVTDITSVYNIVGDAITFTTGSDPNVFVGLTRLNPNPTLNSVAISSYNSNVLGFEQRRSEYILIDSIVPPNDGNDPFKSISSIKFGNKGTELFVLVNNSTIYGITMNGAHTLPDSYTGFSQKFVIDDIIVDPRHFAFTNNGMKLFVSGQKSFINGERSTIFEYDLSAPFDISKPLLLDHSFTVPLNQDNDETNIITAMLLTDINHDEGKLLHISGSQDGRFISRYELPGTFTLGTSFSSSDITSIEYIDSTYNYNANPRAPLFTNNDMRTGILLNPSNIEDHNYNMTVLIQNDNDDQVIQYIIRDPPGQSALTDFSLSATDPFVLLARTSSTGFPMPVTIDLNEEIDDATGLAFSNNGTQLFIIDEEDSTIYQYDLTTPFTITTASYNSNIDYNIVDPSGQDISPQDVLFSRVGTTMFVLNHTHVHQYNLQNGPFDINTADPIISDVILDVKNQVQEPTGFALSNDGHSMFVVGHENNIYEYVLPNENSLDGATYTGISYEATDIIDSADTEPRVITDITFSPNGMVMFIMDNQNIVHAFALPAPFDFVNVNAFPITLSGLGADVAMDTNLAGIIFSPDGTKMITASSSGLGVSGYSLSIPFDIDELSLSFQSFFYVGNEVDIIHDFALNDNGRTLYVLGSTLLGPDTIYQYTLNEPFVIDDLAEYTGVYFVLSNHDDLTDNLMTGMAFSNDGTDLFLVGQENDSIYKVSLAEAFNIVSNIDSVEINSINDLNLNNHIANEDIVDINFDHSGTIMYLLSDKSDVLFRFELSAPFEIDDQITQLFSFNVKDQVESPTGFTITGQQQIKNSDNDIIVDQTSDRMFVLDNATDSINRYIINDDNVFNLVNTNSMPAQMFELNSEISSPTVIMQPTSLKFSRDGTSMFVIGLNNTENDLRIYHYTLSMPFDINTASFNDRLSRSTLSITSIFADSNIEGFNEASMEFSSDGTKLFIIGNTSPPNMVEVDTGIVFSLLIKDMREIGTFGNVGDNPVDIVFNRDGTEMFIINGTNNAIDGYGLLEPFNPSLLSGVNNTYTIDFTDPTGIAFSSDGLSMISVSNNLNYIEEFTLNEPFDLSRINENTDRFTLILDGSRTLPPNYQGVAYSIGGDKVFALSNEYNNVLEFSVPGIDLVNTNPGNPTSSLSVPYLETHPTDIELSIDGSRLYVTGNSTSMIHEFALEEPFSISNFNYLDSISVTAQNDNPQGIAFNDTGNKMYVVGANSSGVESEFRAPGSRALLGVYEYDLSVPFDISSANYNGGMLTTISDNNNPDIDIGINDVEDVSPTDVTFISGGNFMLIAGAERDRISQYRSPTINLSANTYDFNNPYVPGGISFNFCDDRDCIPTGIAAAHPNDFNNVNFFVLTDEFNLIHSFTADNSNDYGFTSDGGTRNSGIQDGSQRSFAPLSPLTIDSPTGNELTKDGSKHFVIDSTYNTIHEYAMDTAFEPRTASAPIIRPIHTLDAAPQAITFSNDGSKMFTVGTVGGNVNEFILSIPFDASTAIDTNTFTVFSQEKSPTDITFSKDGTNMYILGLEKATIFSYDLSTPFDTSTAIYNNEFYNTTRGTSSDNNRSLTSMEFNSDGTILFISGIENNNILVHETEPFGLPDGDSRLVLNTIANSIQDIKVLSHDGTPNNNLLYVLDAVSNVIHIYKLNFDPNVTISLLLTFPLTDLGSYAETNPTGMAFSDNGNTMYIVGTGLDQVISYSLDAPFILFTPPLLSSYNIDVSDNSIEFTFNQPINLDPFPDTDADINIMLDNGTIITTTITSATPVRLGSPTFKITPVEISIPANYVFIFLSNIMGVTGNSDIPVSNELCLGCYVIDDINNSTNKILLNNDTINIIEPYNRVRLFNHTGTTPSSITFDSRLVNATLDMTNLVLNTTINMNNFVPNTVRLPNDITIMTGLADNIDIELLIPAGPLQSCPTFNNFDLNRDIISSCPFPLSLPTNNTIFGTFNLPEDLGPDCRELELATGNLYSCVSIGVNNELVLINGERPARIKLTDQANNIAWVGLNENSVKRITQRCPSDSVNSVQELFNDLRSNGQGVLLECTINDGRDLIIWTTHFSTFGTSRNLGGGTDPSPPVLKSISINSVIITPEQFRNDYSLETAIIAKTGAITPISLELFESTSWKYISHVELCLNMEISNNIVCDSDTKIIWDVNNNDNNNDLEIIDPDNLIHDARITMTEINAQSANFNLDIIFENTIDKPDIQISAWDSSRESLSFTINNALVIEQGTIIPGSITLGGDTPNIVTSNVTSVVADINNTNTGTSNNTNSNINSTSSNNDTSNTNTNNDDRSNDNNNDANNDDNNDANNDSNNDNDNDTIAIIKQWAGYSQETISDTELVTYLDIATTNDSQETVSLPSWAKETLGKWTTTNKISIEQLKTSLSFYLNDDNNNSNE